MSSDYKLAIKIAGELDSSLSAAVKSAQGMLDGLNGGGKGKGVLQTIGSAAGGVMKTIAKASAGSLAVIGGTAAAATKAAVDTGKEFESAMSDLAGTAGITRASEEYAQLEAAARNVGATTNKTATESAEALKYMALAGWSTEDSIQALDDMVKLSSASGTDLARTSDLVTDSMGALGLTMKDYGGYMDMVARADSAANYSASEFMEAMIGAGGAARMLGIDVTELGTAAGILANNGTKGSEAGTKLNSIFARMAGQTKPVQEALAALGTTITDDQGNFLSMEQMFGNIKQGLAGIADESERARIMKDLFGTHNLSEAQYLLDSIGEGGDWESLYTNLDNAKAGVDELGNAADTLDERYATATDNLQGDLDVMKSAASDFGIEIYQSIVGDGEGGLRGAVQEVTNIIGQLKEAFQTEGLSGLAQGIADAIGDVSTKIAEKAPQAIQDAQEFSSKLITELGNTKNADAIGSAVSGIVTNLGAGFLTYTGDFAVAAGNIMTGIVQGLNDEGAGAQIGEAASAMIGKIGDWFAENGGELGTAAGQLISSLAESLASNAGNIVSAGIDIVSGLAQGLITGAGVLIGSAPQIVMDIIGGILESIPHMFEAGAALASALLDGLLSMGEGINNFFYDMMTVGDVDLGSVADYANIAPEINAAISQGLDEGAYLSGQSAAQEIMRGIADGTYDLGELQGMLDAGDTGDLDFGDVSTAVATYAEAVQQLREAGVGAEESLAETQQAASETASGISADTQALIDSANGTADSVGSLGDTIQQELNAAKEGAVSSVNEAKAALNTDLTEGMNADTLGSLIESIDTGNIDQVVAQLNSAMTEIQTATSTATTQVSADFTSMGSTVSTTGSQAVADCQAAASGITSAFAAVNLSSIASAMMVGLTAGIRAGGQAAVAAARSIASEIASVMQSALQIHSPSRVMEGIGEYIPAGLAVGMENGIPDIQTATTNMAGAVTGDSFSKSMQTFNSPASAPGQTNNGGGITFAPQITITGNASQGDVQNALQWSMAEFRRMYERMMADDRRTAFA